jgi:hypothetical protein
MKELKNHSVGQATFFSMKRQASLVESAKGAPK